jgi:hypothetical protein
MGPMRTNRRPQERRDRPMGLAKTGVTRATRACCAEA